MKDEDYALFGVDKKAVEKSGEIFPTLELGKLEQEAKVFGVIEQEKPKVVEHSKKFNLSDKEKEQKAKGEDVKIKTSVLNLFVNKIERPQSDGSFLPVEMNETYSLWLSSKSLGLGLGKIAEEHDGNLKGVKIKIHKGKAEYKEFGENTCYSVSEVKEND